MPDREPAAAAGAAMAPSRRSARVAPLPATATSTHLFVVPWSLDAPGGVNEVVTNLYRRFTQDGGALPHVLLMSWRHRRPETMTAGGRDVTQLRLRVPFGLRGGRNVGAPVKWVLFLLPEALRLSSVLRRRRVAVVNVHFPSLAALQFLVAGVLLRARPRLVLSFHGLDIVQAEASRGVARWLWRLLLRRADVLVACSTALRNRVAAFEPRAAARLVVIHNGVDAARLLLTRNPAARLDTRLDGRRIVLCVASYEDKKGLDVLIRAFAQLRARGVDDACVALVGPERGAGAALRALAITLGVADAVVFCGPVPHTDLHRYYDAATVFCLPSRAEPFGIVLLEAGVFHRPVVASRVDGIPEVVTHDVHARLVPPGDAGALADTLASLLDDPATCARLAQALHERVVGRFGWDRASAAYRGCCAVERETTAMPAAVDAG